MRHINSTYELNLNKDQIGRLKYLPYGKGILSISMMHTVDSGIVHVTVSTPTVLEDICTLLQLEEKLEV